MIPKIVWCFKNIQLKKSVNDNLTVNVKNVQRKFTKLFKIISYTYIFHYNFFIEMSNNSTVQHSIIIDFSIDENVFGYKIFRFCKVCNLSNFVT